MIYDVSYLNFIQRNHPNYSSDDRVLICDILFRYIDDDDVSPEDLIWIKKDFRTKEDVLKELKRLETSLFSEALDSFYYKNTGMQ